MSLHILRSPVYVLPVLDESSVVSECSSKFWNFSAFLRLSGLLGSRPQLGLEVSCSGVGLGLSSQEAHCFHVVYKSIYESVNVDDRASLPRPLYPFPPHPSHGVMPCGLLGWADGWVRVWPFG